MSSSTKLNLLDKIELRVLQDIAEFLKIPHAVQTLLCAEKTPTLSCVLPAYEDLFEMLKAYKIICPHLNCAISTCIAKIEEYVNKSRKTRIYAFAMSMLKIFNRFYSSVNYLKLVINLITKLSWIEDYWTSDECQAAKEWMLTAVSSS